MLRLTSSAEERLEPLTALAAGSLGMSNPEIRTRVAQLLNSKYGTPDQRRKVFRAMKEAELTEEYEGKVDLKTKALAMELRERLVKEGAAEPAPPADG